MCIGSLEVGPCGVAKPESQLGHRALLAGSLTGPLALFGLLDLAVVGGQWLPTSP